MTVLYIIFCKKNDVEKQKKSFLPPKKWKKKLKILFANLNLLFLLTDQSIIQKKKKDVSRK